MGMVFVTAGACEKLDCDCCRLDSKRIEEGDPVPPLHEGCTCYLVSEECYERLTRKQMDRFFELDEKKPTVKRIKIVSAPWWLRPYLWWRLWVLKRRLNRGEF